MCVYRLLFCLLLNLVSSVVVLFGIVIRIGLVLRSQCTNFVFIYTEHQ